MGNLYEINSQIENFEFIVDEETGEVLNIGMLDELKLTKDEKIENIALYIKNLKAFEESLSNEIKALQERKKSKQSKIKNLSKYLENALNGEKFETTNCAISFRKSTSVEVKEDFIEYAKAHGYVSLYKVETKETANKTNIKKFIKENGELPFAELKESRNIQIK